MKLKYSEIKTFRHQQLIKQGNCCSLCGDPIAEDQAVLDHDHKSGQLRGVLHRGCNSLLGKIENSMPRSLVDIGRLANISKNLIKYLTADAVSEFLHPTFKIKEPAMPGRGRGRGKKPPKR
jgi:hypothetical protein